MKSFKQNLLKEIMHFCVFVLRLSYLPIAFLLYALKLPFLEYVLLIFILLQPGNIIYKFIHNSKQNPWPIVLSFRIAYSIIFIYVIGLTNTFASYYYSIENPLGRYSIIFTFGILYSLLLLILFAFRRQDFKITAPKLPTLKDWHFGVHLILPFLAYCGATLQNNGSSNVLTYILYVSIFLLFLFYLVRSKSYKDEYVATFILSSSISLLLSYSLRSNYVSGYDISQEYKYFMETKNALTWIPEKIVDAYQACLSITILPTIISELSSLRSEFIFKFVFALLLSPIPVIAFYIFRRYFAKDVAITGVFFLLSQTWYYTQLPTILRQGIAYVFYALIFYSLFAEDNSRVRKNIALVIIGIGLILSHYTTTYLTISILILIKLILIILKLIRFPKLYTKLISLLKIPANKYINLHSSISFISILLLLLFTMLWYVRITNTFPNLSSKTGIQLGGSNAFNLGDNLAKIRGIFNYKFQDQNTTQRVNSYVNSYTINLHKTRPYLWDKDQKKNPVEKADVVTLIQVQEQFPKSYVPIWLSQTLVSLFNIVRTLLNNVFLPLSILLIFFFKRYKQIQVEYIVLQLLLMSSIIVISLLPQGLKSYNIERLYTQLLITSSAFIGWIIFGFFKLVRLPKLALCVVAFMFSLYFFFYSGIIQYFIGGSQPLTITSSGSSYYKNYAHSSEVASASWLGKYLTNSFVFADSAGRNRLIAYGSVDQNKIISPFFPSALNNNSYVYLAFHNYKKNVVLVTDLGVNAFVKTPKEFLDMNKNKIYSTSSTAVYK